MKFYKTNKIVQSILILLREVFFNHTFIIRENVIS